MSGVGAHFDGVNLANVNVPRRCSRPGCPHFAVATLTYVYSDSTAVVIARRFPRAALLDLCLGHASRITAPRGWERMRHADRCRPIPMRTTSSPWPMRCVRVGYWEQRRRRLSSTRTAQCTQARRVPAFPPVLIARHLRVVGGDTCGFFPTPPTDQRLGWRDTKVPSLQEPPPCPGPPTRCAA